MHQTSALFGISHVPGMKPNDYCGPAAISCLTGVSCEFAAWHIKAGRGTNRGVASVCVSELVDLLRGLDCKVDEIEEAQGITLAKFDKDIVSGVKDAVLIYLTDHFIVCDPYDRTYYDNHVHGPQWIDEFPSPRRKIKHAYSVQRAFNLSTLHEMEKAWIRDPEELY